MATPALHDLLANIRRRLDGVEQSYIPSIANDVKTMSEQQEESASARADLAHVANQIEEADLEAFECEDERTKLVILGELEGLRERSNRARAALRSALLQSKKRLDASGSSTRAELFGGPRTASHGGANGAGGGKDDTLMGATSDVQDTLHRTLQLMRQELDRSVLSTQMLEQQTSLMSSTSDQYTSFSTLLDVSKSLITSMERADVIDRLLLAAAVLFFALVCLYILKKRVLDKGLRIVGLFPAAGRVISSVVSKGSSLLATSSALPSIPMLATQSPRAPSAAAPPASEPTSVLSVEEPPSAVPVVEPIAPPPIFDDLDLPPPPSPSEDTIPAYDDPPPPPQPSPERVEELDPPPSPSLPEDILAGYEEPPAPSSSPPFPVDAEEGKLELERSLEDEKIALGEKLDDLAFEAMLAEDGAVPVKDPSVEQDAPETVRRPTAAEAVETGEIDVEELGDPAREQGTAEQIEHARDEL